MPELRKDPVTHRWVIISIERAKRPHDFAAKREPLTPDKLPEKDEKCPFCEGNERMTPPEVLAYRDPSTEPNTPGWLVRVIPNKFPALRQDLEYERRGIRIFQGAVGYGVHEVIIETPKHNLDLPFRSPREVADVIRAYRDRYIELSRDPNLHFVLIFRNRGPEAGASLVHPHSQIIATPIIPKRIAEELNGAKTFYEVEGECVYCHLIREEKEHKERVIYENTGFVAVSAFAARFPFETWILPKKHQANFGDITDAQVRQLADVLRRVIKAMYNLLGDPPYNYVIHTVPANGDGREYYHWHIEILPRLTRVAGFEWGTGFYINVVTPEDAARYLREQIRKDMEEEKKKGEWYPAF